MVQYINTQIDHCFYLKNNFYLLEIDSETKNKQIHSCQKTMTDFVNNSIWLAVVLWHVIYHVIVVWPVMYCSKPNPIFVSKIPIQPMLFMVITKRNRLLMTPISIVRVCSLDLIYIEQNSCRRKSIFCVPVVLSNFVFPPDFTPNFECGLY